MKYYTWTTKVVYLIPTFLCAKEGNEDCVRVRSSLKFNPTSVSGASLMALKKKLLVGISSIRMERF
ncbi:MAG: hypothetical protein EOO01_16780 [Chitinophagaceae bacterium]|nr:MAG: hypothetical protein EOO01_16780 [Chitinophagaceae bacterium]